MYVYRVLALFLSINAYRRQPQLLLWCAGWGSASGCHGVMGGNQTLTELPEYGLLSALGQSSVSDFVGSNFSF